MTEPEAATHGEHVLYSVDHRALICTRCPHAITSGEGVYRHFRDTHPSVDLDTRKKLTAHVETLDVMEPKSICIPERDSSIVDGLSLLDGFECHGCGYVCASEGTMMKHCQKEFKWTTAQRKKWNLCKVQTFLPKNQGEYFVVSQMEDEVDQRTEVDSVDKSIAAMIDRAKEMDEEEDERLGIVDIDQHMVDKSPWMRRTG